MSQGKEHATLQEQFGADEFGTDCIVRNQGDAYSGLRLLDKAGA